MQRAHRSSGKWKPPSASAISTVDGVAVPLLQAEGARRAIRGRARLLGELEHRLDVGGARLAPRVRDRERAAVELRQEADRVHLERRRVDDPLEPVGRDVVRATDAEPGVGVRGREAEDRADDLAEHRPESDPGSFGSWTFAPSRVWHTTNPAVSADVVIQMSMPNLLMSSVQSSSSR